MQQSIIILAILTLFHIETYAQSKNTNTCINAKELAKKDMYNKELKYYTFGLLAPDAHQHYRAIILKEYYNVELRHMGCIMDPDLLCYSKQAEQILKRKYGINFWNTISKQADRMLQITKNKH